MCEHRSLATRTSFLYSPVQHVMGTPKILLGSPLVWMHGNMPILAALSVFSRLQHFAAFVPGSCCCSMASWLAMPATDLAQSKFFPEVLDR